MSNLWERFDTIAKPEDVMEAKSQFAPIEEGTYKVKLEELIPGESKSGLPMLKGKFRMTDDNRILFYNQMLQNLNYPDMTAVNIAQAVAFVSGLVGEDYDFDGLAKFADFVSQIPIGSEHTLELTYTGKNKDYATLKVVEDNDTEGNGGEWTEIPQVGDEDLPF